MNLSKKKANAKHATSPQRAAAGSVEKPASKMRELRDPDPKAPAGYRCGRCGVAKKGHVCPYMFIKNGEVSSETTVQNPGVSDGTEGIYNCKSCGEKKKFHICPFGRVLILLECVPIDPAARSSVEEEIGGPSLDEYLFRDMGSLLDDISLVEEEIDEDLSLAFSTM